MTAGEFEKNFSLYKDKNPIYNNKIIDSVGSVSDSSHPYIRIDYKNDGTYEYLNPNDTLTITIDSNFNTIKNNVKSFFNNPKKTSQYGGSRKGNSKSRRRWKKKEKCQKNRTRRIRKA